MTLQYPAQRKGKDPTTPTAVIMETRTASIVAVLALSSSSPMKGVAATPPIYSSVSFCDDNNTQWEEAHRQCDVEERIDTSSQYFRAEHLFVLGSNGRDEEVHS